MKLGICATLLAWTTLTAASCDVRGGEADPPSERTPLTIRDAATGRDEEVERVVKTREEWKEVLAPEQFRILRQKGTERAFSGKYHDHKGDGLYRCAGCGADLFDSKTKFSSGTGWPSFWAPISGKNVATETDRGFGMVREEVLCARCGGHLGHVFEDGPRPTGLRYCINSGALEFVERTQVADAAADRLPSSVETATFGLG